MTTDPEPHGTPWTRMQARIEAMLPGRDRTQALIDMNAMLIEFRAALRSVSADSTAGLGLVFLDALRCAECGRPIAPTGWYHTGLPPADMLDHFAEPDDPAAPVAPEGHVHAWEPNTTLDGWRCEDETCGAQPERAAPVAQDSPDPLREALAALERILAFVTNDPPEGFTVAADHIAIWAREGLAAIEGVSRDH